MIMASVAASTTIDATSTAASISESGHSNSKSSPRSSSRSQSPGFTSRESSRKSKSSSSRKPSSSKSKKMETEAEIAAMRHLRQMVVQSIQNDDDNNTPSTDRRPATVRTFERIMEDAEKKLHFNEKIMNDDPLQSTQPKNTGKKKQSWLRTRLMSSNKQRGNQAEESTAPSKGQQEKKSKKIWGGALETLEEEEIRGDVEDQFGRTTNDDPAADRVGAEFTPVEVPAVEDDDDTHATATDSIIDMRIANSEDYAASVCSLRSLNTFEKDNLNLIIAEQAEMDEVSMNTFEKDFLAKQACGENVVLPLQVIVNGNQYQQDDVEDDLTVGTIKSETTFEQDARSIIEPRNDGLQQPPPANTVTPLPALVTAFHNETMNHNFGALDTKGIHQQQQNHHHHQQQQQQQQQQMTRPVGSAPTTSAVFDSNRFFRNAVSAESNLVSVSTFEKDTAAINALACKIGRQPSTTSKMTSGTGMSAGAMDDYEERSQSTFTQDLLMKQEAELLAQAKAPLLGMVRMNPSEQSAGTFEKDYGTRNAKSAQQLGSIVEVRAGVSQPCAKCGGSLMPLVTSPMAQQQEQFVVSPLSSTMPTPVGSPIPSPPSHTAFENDNNPGWFNNNQASKNKASLPKDMSLGRFEKDASHGMAQPIITSNATIAASTVAGTRATGLSTAARQANAEAAAKAQAQLPKLSPLIVELSPNAIDRGVRLKDREMGLFGKFMSHFGG